MLNIFSKFSFLPFLAFKKLPKIKNSNCCVFSLSLLRIATLNMPCFLLSTFSLIWIYFSRKFTSYAVKATENFISSFEKASFISAMHLAKVLVFDCILKSILYWIRPILESLILLCVESKLHSNCLALSYEEFNIQGSAIQSSKLYRNALAIKDSVCILIFDILGNVIQLAVSFSILKLIVGTKLLLFFIISLILISSCHFLLILKLKKIKKEAQEIDDVRAKDMTEIFENFLLTKITGKDENLRLSQFFISDALLKFVSFSSIIKFQVKALFMASSLFLLYCSKSAHHQIGVFLIHSAMILRSFNNFVSKFIELESKRIEILDMNDIINEESTNDKLTDKLANEFNNEAYTNDNLTNEESNNEAYRNEAYTNDNLTNDELIVSDSENLSINYENITIFINNCKILQNIKFSLNSGDKIALIGKNGSGKTTFLRFLLGFHQHDGIISMNIPKKFISYLPQNNFLFKTVYEELMESADSEESMECACAKFNFIETILGFPDGFNTETSQLSESHRQMISVIQSYLKKSKILLADEPGSLLDKDSEELVINNLLNSPNHIVKIISLHSTAYLDKFNKIFIFENNSITIKENY